MSGSKRGHVIDPRRRILLQAANTMAKQRKYAGQLRKLRTTAQMRIGQLERLIVRIERILKEGINDCN